MSPIPAPPRASKVNPSYNPVPGEMTARDANQTPATKSRYIKFENNEEGIVGITIPSLKSVYL
jgi:hypothetical protein